MSWQVDQLKYAFGLTGMFSIYGVTLVAAWFVGDSLGYSTTYRIVIIGVVLLTLPVALVGSFLASRRKKKAKKKEEAEAKEAEGKESSEESNKTTKPSGNYDDLDKGAAEVIKFLKSSNLGVKGEDTVYSLPWYLVVGSPKSGKSALVLGSGLNFQNLPSQRQSEQKFIRPTRQIDWRITSDAVFVDTAGRFQSENTDKDEWASVIETVKKHRPKRPIDGLVLAINAEKILNSNEREIDEHAKILRDRLDEVTKRLKSRFPVYLVFTHADAIEGFRDSFSTSKKEGENLVWGTTIPLEKSDNAQALFDSEYELLQDSITKRRLIRLSAPFSSMRQLRIFNFPLHFGSARRKLGTFVSTLFRPNPFSESPFLRGFYFTAVPVNRDRNKKRRPTPNKGQTVGKTYFTKRFFRDVILRDKDLVKTFQDQKQSPPILGWLLTAFGTFITLILLAFCAYSVYINRAFVNDAAAKGEALFKMNDANKNKSPLNKSVDETKKEIDTIENLRKILVKLDDYERNGPPFYMRFGFYSGNRIYKEKLLDAYYNAIERRFKKPMLEGLETQLRNFASKQVVPNTSNLTNEQQDVLDKHYNYLAAYLMLTEKYKDKAQATLLADSLKDLWFSKSKVPEDYKSVAEEQMLFYFKQVDRRYKNEGEDKSAFPFGPLNTDVVKVSRARLKSFPPYLRYLKRTVDEVNKEGDEVTVDTILQSNNQETLSGKHTIPFAYTINGYRKLMREKIENANKELRKDDWVIEEKAVDAKFEKDELKKLKDKYFKVYSDHWRKLVSSTSVSPYTTNEDMERVLVAFADTDSPMRTLLEEVARNTNLSASPPAKPWYDVSWIMEWWSGKKQEGGTGGNTVVEQEFRPLFAFVGSGEKDGSNKQAFPVSKYGTQIKRLAQPLTNLSENKKNQFSRELAEEKGKFSDRLKDVEGKINSLLGAFKNTSAGRELTSLMNQPTENVRLVFGADEKQRLKRDWEKQILAKAKEIEKGYPFTNEGESDLAKVSDFLKPEAGTLSKFFNSRLKKYFEEVDGKWVMRESSPVKFNVEFVDYLNNAFRLQKVLFGDNQTPNFNYKFALQPIKSGVIEITIDGQKTTSEEETGSKTLKFPAGNSTSTGVFMRYTSTSDTSSTSGKTLPPTQSPPPTTDGPNADTNPAMFQNDSGDERRFQGSWGLFKFFDNGNPKKQSDGKYTLTYRLGGKAILITIEPQGGDLFDKNIFRSIKAPDSILQ